MEPKYSITERHGRSWPGVSVVLGVRVGLGVLAIAAGVCAQSLPEFSFVPAAHEQPEGPTYDFRIARHEIRNDQFVEFLNDAIVNLDNERGHFLYFDDDTGDVYVHSVEEGEIDVHGAGPLIFEATNNPAISYDTATNTYEAVAGFEDHPVTRVSWYGTVKYCNWLTIATGLGTGQRAYAESPSTNLNGWHPVTITTADWTGRDLNDSERQALLEKLGYRLPMDAVGAGSEAGSYNEWFKAAAWDNVAGVNRAYGFGRDDIFEEDANYRCSLDPFEDEFECFMGGTTPVGYYDGVNTIRNGTVATVDTDNPYQLYDVSGNVWEWMQGKGFDSGDRHNRGGSFLSNAQTLQTHISAERAASIPSDSTGFRIVQSVVDELLVTPAIGLTVLGVWGGPYNENTPTSKSFRVMNVTDHPVGFDIFADAPWVTVDYVAPRNDNLAPYTSLDVTVLVDPACEDGLRLGANTATVTVLNLDDGVRIQRPVSFGVAEPLKLTPNTSFDVVAFFGDELPTKTYTFDNEGLSAVQWSVDWTDTTSPPADVEWLRFNDDPVAPSGTLEPDATADTTISFDIDGLSARAYSANVAFHDDCTAGVFSRSVRLTLKSPITASPTTDVASSGIFGGPFRPDLHEFTLKNKKAAAVDWEVIVEPVEPETDASWLSVTPIAGTMAVLDEEAVVTVSFSEAAYSKAIGSYAAKIIFRRAGTGFTVERTITLEVTSLLVEPETDITFTGVRGGPVQPVTHLYTLQNSAIDELIWSAEFADTTDPPSGRNWLTLEPQGGLILNPDGTVNITVSPSAEAALLAGGTYTGVITIGGSVPSEAFVTRTVTLILAEETFSVPMIIVAVDDPQPGGPEHPFRIGKYEITNNAFVRFLSDTLENATTPRGEFLDHDTANGIVRLSGDGTIIFDASASGAVGFEDGRYVVLDGKDNFPVGGVSWYGAAKFCNWMTRIQGMTSPDERVYHEGPTAADWYALADPPALLDLRGFRLPADDALDTEGLYNEWYKAAAWNPVTETNAVYGFGRDALLDEDANFRGSGDPHEPGPCPVGFFNGVNALAGGGGATANTSNAFGLYDLTGNVAEWVHDAGVVPGERGVRGGHFDTPVTSLRLRNDERGSFPPESALPFVGFRVAQAIDPELDDLNVSRSATLITGIVGGPLSRDSINIIVRNEGQQTADVLTVVAGAAWLRVDEAAARQVPPGAVVEIPVWIDASADAPGATTTPPGGFSLVSAEDAQLGGPDYDYLISTTEVTNAGFAALLNDALTDSRRETPGLRSQYMFFDTDSGSVYINDQAESKEGNQAPSDVLNTLLYDASVGRISYDPAALDDGGFVVESGYENHPVVGVSWYGALKYCNWRTINDGITYALRVYDEASTDNPAGWRPVVVDDAAWASTGLSGARRLLVEDTVGYRLPMDDEADGASPFNEWHKAASARKDADGYVSFGAAYGFGRDALDGQDANYHDSGETPSEGTTPARLFNGSNRLYQTSRDCYPPDPDAPLTRKTDNAFGLYDLTGNVAEWTNGFLSGDPNTRATRGGSWRDDVGSNLLTNTGRRALAPGDTDDQTGFRLVRGLGHVGVVTITDAVTGTAQQQHIVLHLREPFVMTPLMQLTHAGPYRALFDSLPDRPLIEYTLQNRSEADMEWEVTVNREWLDAVEVVSQETSGTIVGAAAPETSTLTLGVQFNESADALAPGTHEASVVVTNVTTGAALTRSVEITVEPPLRLLPESEDPHEFTMVWTAPTDGMAALTLQLVNDATFDMNYSIVVTQPWLTVEPVDPVDLLADMLPPGDTLDLSVLVNAAAETLAVGEYSANVRALFTDPDDLSVTGSAERKVLLNVEEPIVVDQPADPWRFEPDFVPDTPLPIQSYTVTNRDDAPIEVLVTTDADWLDISDTLIEVVPDGQQAITVTASFNDNVFLMPDGEYETDITFHDVITGVTVCRTVQLNIVQTLTVTPFDGYTTAGIVGRTPSPSFKTYRLTNVARDAAGPIDWSVSVEAPGADWVRFNGLSADSGVLEDGESASVFVTIDTTNLPAGQHQARIVFEALPDGEVTTRDVRITLVEPRFTPAESFVSGSEVQANGPAYSYRVGSFPVTNAEFVAFLNDAILNLDNDRGQFMFFDTATGDVFINTTQTGEVGNDPDVREVKMFSAVAGQIEMVGGAYRVVADAADFASHPVSGVSWYGALKFCNWLTIDQGMLPERRCYLEDNDDRLSSWRPVAIAKDDWEARDLSDAERQALVTDCRGYRMPMDDGHNNAGAALDAADAYNEWFKAAAWHGTLRQNTAYGFGRNTLTAADANFRGSGDPLDNGTTPVGYYDGSIKSAVFPTAANDNYFGVFDMTGNIYEWMQGRFTVHPDSINFRTLRGGSWNDLYDSLNLRTNARTFALPSLTDPKVGFRVLRTITPGDGDYNADGFINATDSAALSNCVNGPAAEISPDCAALDLNADSRVDLADIAAFQMLFGESIGQ